MKRLVLYTQRVEVVESYHERRDCADQRIAAFIHECGYTPVPVPNNPEIAVEIADKLKPAGIVLVGGNSLVKYGGNAPERDATDKAMIEYAIRKYISLYGFCRGMQSVLDYFGNDLIQVTGHVAVRHVVSGVDGDFEVNSYHGQGCVNLRGDSLEILLQTEDGVIEKIRHKDYPIVCTMWHPEREEPFRDIDKECFINLIKGRE